jgi:succinate-semialdehyde dehydrogenase / glutarate-semialdehyde dehydrogenase
VRRSRHSPSGQPRTARRSARLISWRAVQGVDALVRQAIAAGARISHRAPVPDSKGWFYPPTVLADVPADADILDAEIFRPVAPIVAWHDDSELLKLVNASEMGLAAYVYAGELQRAMRLGEAFDAGMVGVNRGVVSDPSAPFGGVKQSGLGPRAPAPVSRNSRRLSTSASTGRCTRPRFPRDWWG